MIPYRCAVLHHGVVELVALGSAPREEAALAHVIVEVLQTAVPGEGERGTQREREREIVRDGWGQRGTEKYDKDESAGSGTQTPLSCCPRVPSISIDAKQTRVQNTSQKCCCCLQRGKANTWISSRSATAWRAPSSALEGLLNSEMKTGAHPD